MCSSASLFYQSIPREHVRWLREQKDPVPPGVAVFACVMAPHVAFGYIERNHWPNFSTVAAEDERDSIRL